MSSETEHEQSLAGRVGARLRKQRTDAGRTLAEVAAASDVSVSYLSAVEHGGSVPSLPVLARVTHALGVTIAEVVRDEDEVRLRASRLDDAQPGVRVVSHDDLQLGIAFLVAGPGDSGEYPLDVPGGDVFVYLRSGHLEITVDGESWELLSGDALDAAAPQTIGWRALEQSSAVWAGGLPRQR
jgi:transcriptional regulator with XRE-family HTH domain